MRRQVPRADAAGTPKSCMDSISTASRPSSSPKGGHHVVHSLFAALASVALPSAIRGGAPLPRVLCGAIQTGCGIPTFANAVPTPGLSRPILG
jgi:hypothetical protein